MSTYTAQVFRDSDQWVIEVLELDVVMDYSRVDPDAVSLAAGARAERPWVGGAMPGSHSA